MLPFPILLPQVTRTIKRNILQEKLRELLVDQSLRELTSLSREQVSLPAEVLHSLTDLGGRKYPTPAGCSHPDLFNRGEKKNPEVLAKFTAQSQGLTERPRAHHRSEEHFPSPPHLTTTS